MDRLLAGIAKRSGVALHRMTIQEARAAYVKATRTFDIAPVKSIVTSTETAISGNRSVQLRVSAAPRALNDRHLLLWVHGGGFCVGDAAMTDALCSAFAHRLQARVVSIDYRLAPEHPLPAALDDVVTAVEWCAQQFPNTPLSLLGDSAGAALALSAAAECSKRGKPAVAALVLCYPMTMMPDETVSRRHYAHGHFLTMADIEWMRELAKLPAAGERLDHLRFRHWPDRPRTLVALAHRDPLFDEGATLAGHLRNAGLEVHELHLLDLIHGCLHMGGIVPVVRQVHEAIALFIEASSKE